MSRRWLHTALALCLATGTVVTLAGGAHADTRQRLAAAQRQLDALDQQAEIYAERMNAARDAYVAASRRATAAQHAADAAGLKLAAARAQLGKFAAVAYKSGGTFGTSSVLDLTAGDPTQAMDRLALLDAVSRSQQQVLATVAAAQHDAAATTATATAMKTAAHQQLVKVQSARQQILDAAAQVQTLLRQLHRKAQAEAAAAAAAALARQSATPPPAPVGVGGAQAARIAVQWAYRELGKPYVWGAAGPDSFDCSGLTQYVYGKAGIYLPHYTGDQWNAGRHVDRSQLQPGDLVFYYSDLHHMALYIGDGRVIEAPHTGDVVKIAPLDIDPYAGAVRVAG